MQYNIILIKKRYCVIQVLSSKETWINFSVYLYVYQSEMYILLHVTAVSLDNKFNFMK